MEQQTKQAPRHINAASSSMDAYDSAPTATGDPTGVVAVPVLSLRPADSPRLNGEDKAHIARLAQTETSLPPILVDRRTMRVIDGMHRLMAASVQGRETIDVRFFVGSEADIFLRAVQENVTHGLPLSQADRRAAAERIIATHPHMSDRAIGHTVGLAAKTVATIRKNSSEDLPQSTMRVGRDGRVRPLDGGVGRRRAAELLAQRPEASLRDVARAAGISPATALDVRKRLNRGESPVPEKPAAPLAADGNCPQSERDRGGSPVRTIRFSPRASEPPDAAAAVEKLLRDPSLRNNERGKGMLRLLHINAVGAEQLPSVAAAVPPHCVSIVGQLARQYARMWQEFARELDGRARIIDPSAAQRLMDRDVNQGDARGVLGERCRSLNPINKLKALKMLYPVVTELTMNELTERLTVGEPVVMGGADPTVEELRNRTGAMGYVLVKFTQTRGGTELGFPLAAS